MQRCFSGARREPGFVRAAIACAVVFLCLHGHALPALAQQGSGGLDAVRVLKIHFEDDHSGSFFHLAETLELDEPHALILLDSHSDASAVVRSDDVRRQLREVRTLKERSERLEKWRRDGRVQFRRRASR